MILLKFEIRISVREFKRSLISMVKMIEDIKVMKNNKIYCNRIK